MDCGSGLDAGPAPSESRETVSGIKDDAALISGVAEVGLDFLEAIILLDRSTDWNRNRMV